MIAPYFHQRKYRAEGPNHLWCIDIKNKPKPLGFRIHGCISGYNRKELWLEVSSSNKNS